MFDSVTYRDTESEEDDLGDGEERCAKDDISNGPSIFEGTEDEDEL